MTLTLPVLALALIGAMPARAQDLAVASPDIVANGVIPSEFEFDGFGCKGTNRSSVLRWKGASAGTKSYAITVYDADAPTGSGWCHWMVVNIPAEADVMPAGACNVAGANLPPGAWQIRNDFGALARGGVCPPSGDRAHRDVFTRHALKVEKLELPTDATAALAGVMIKPTPLGRPSLSHATHASDR